MKKLYRFWCMVCGKETDKSYKTCPHCGAWETIWFEELEENEEK